MQTDLSHLPSHYSRFAQRVRRRYEQEWAAFSEALPDKPLIAHHIQLLRQQGHELGVALRIVRQWVIERLVHWDCDRQAPLSAVMQTMTALAELSLDLALSEAQAQLDERHGAPLRADGQRALLWIMGMGKLGSRELNVSSDIDLIYVYDQDGETAGLPDGRGRISNFEYFAKAIKALYTLIGNTTEHGFVFRLDLALRPNGNSGPPVISLDALDEYFQVQGREWERFAWLKSRVVAPLGSVQDQSAHILRNSVLPFVFRRYLDYPVFDALRVLHKQIRTHHAQRVRDIKLARGGIREIEFIVQLLQVVRGGQFPELRTRSTLDALPRLTRSGLMPEAEANALTEAYIFLRCLEHRIQYLDDQQTHELPTNADDLAWIAQTLNFKSVQAFEAELTQHRDTVAQEFDKLLGGSQEDVPPTTEVLPGEVMEMPTHSSAEVQQAIKRLYQHNHVKSLREESLNRLSRVVQRSLSWLDEADSGIEEAGVVQLMDWLTHLLRRESYLALLLEQPTVHRRLLRLLGQARWPARYLQQHPGVIDELANSAMLYERFDSAALQAELEERRAALRATNEDDEETLLNILRRAHHAETFRTLTRDVEGQLSVEQVADDLSALADTILRITAQWCWEQLQSRHDLEPAWGIIAYGKLGAKELGYGSDLDLVFVYDDDQENAPAVYASWVRKLISWLSVKTGEGDLYDIDTALRPNGSSGLLVTHFDAYANYQQRRGSNTAWTWEHQAITRARLVLGSEALTERFEAVRHAVITSPRDAQGLRDEILAMREKVRAAHPISREKFDLKHSPGGMVDAEFAVQYLVLLHAVHYPDLTANVGNIALLLRAQGFGLLPDGVGQQAANAYRELRRLQHQARLNEAPTQLDAQALPTERAAIQKLWACVAG